MSEATTHVLTIVGARPQFVKASVVSRAMANRGLRETLVHTGQHYDDGMSDVFFRELGIPQPDINLGIGSGLHGEQTGRMLIEIEKVLLEHRPDWLLLYGDTNSTIAGALAAAKLHVPIAHVEAGPRTYVRTMPEEINRVLTDHLSDLLLVPSQLSVDNLLREGICNDRIRLVGDVMYDVALHFGDLAEQNSVFLLNNGLKSKGYVLATIHRAESTDDPAALRAIADALIALAAETRVVLPLHPRTRNALTQAGWLEEVTNAVSVMEPLGYLDMAMAEKNARLILTDSGGVQKEAFFYRVPCVTLMEQTGWAETVELGWNRVVRPTDASVVLNAVHEADGSTGRPGQPYGDGYAADTVAEALA